MRTETVTMLTGKVMWLYWLSLWVRVLIRLESQLPQNNGQGYQDVTNDLESGVSERNKAYVGLGTHIARLQNV